jgi:phosphoglycolate phosphatase
MSYDLAIFDFDGTLADSSGWVAGVFNGVAKRYGYRCVSDDELQMLRGRPNREIIRYLGVPAWKLPFIANHMRKLSARDAAQIRLFDGVDGLLGRLADSGVQLAIVSSNAEETIRRILGPGNAARIAYYECGASLFGKAAKFRRVLKRSGIASGRVICIGDEARDIDAAHEVGLASGAVTWGYATTDLLRQHRPTLVLDTMDDIVAAVASREPAFGPGS